jgi:ankyrin repeat protein
MRLCELTLIVAAAASSGCAARVHQHAPDARADVTARAGWTPLHGAAADGRTRDVQGLLAEGADPNAREGQGATPLHLAAARGSNDGTVRALLARGADLRALDAYGATPLHWAASHGRPGAVGLLLDAGADVNARAGEQAFTPLHAAAASGDVECVDLLIERGADLGLRDGGGRTPLGVADLMNRTAVGDRLRNAGAGL